MTKEAIYIFVLLFVIIEISLVFSINLDLNHDGEINITDLQLLAAHFQGKAAYNSSFDLNNDSRVDLFDVVKIARSINLSSGAGNSSGNGSNRTVLFSSDWSTATGNSTNALTDGGKWTGTTNSHDNLDVVSASSYFPNAGFSNALKAHLENNIAASVSNHVYGSDPSVGQSIYNRIYMYLDYPANTSSNGYGGNHPYWDWDGYTDSAQSDILWGFKFGHTQGSTKVNVYVAVYPVSQTYELDVPLDVQTPYRLEIQTSHINSSAYTIGVRIYNSFNVLLYTGANFTNLNGAHEAIDSRSFTLPSTPIWTSISAGTNGVTGWPSSNDTVYHIWGGLAMCTNDWCGPYNNGV